MEKATAPLSLGSASYAAKRAADVVFTLQNTDQLDDQALLKRLNQTFAGYGEQSELSLDDLLGLETVAANLLAIFAAQDTARAAGLLNMLLQQYAQAPRLTVHGGSAWHLHVDGSDHAPWAEWFAASSALALATLLAEKQRNPGGLCAAVSCNRPFIDAGKGGGRSFCSPRCATRERVAAFRKKH